MHPHFREGRIIVASGWFKQLKPRDVVIIAHDGMEKIKRIERFRGYEKREIFVRGDNADQSTDSRDFGWLPADSIRAKILWPRVNF